MAAARTLPQAANLAVFRNPTTGVFCIGYDKHKQAFGKSARAVGKTGKRKEEQEITFVACHGLACRQPHKASDGKDPTGNH